MSLKQHSILSRIPMRHHIGRFAISAVMTGLLLSSQGAMAGISGDLQADRLEDQNGAAIPQTSLFLLVASTSDNTFSINLNLTAGKPISLGSILGSDEVVVARGNLTGGVPAGTLGVLDTPLSIDFTNAVFGGLVQPGQRLALLWFPTLTTADNTLTTGARFGFYDGGVATAANQTDADSSGTDSGPSWIIPSDTSFGYNPHFYTKDATYLSDSTSANVAVAGRATGLVSVPEPSTGVLALFGGLGLLSRRRRA